MFVIFIEKITYLVHGYSFGMDLLNWQEVDKSRPVEAWMEDLGASNHYTYMLQTKNTHVEQIYS